MGPGDFLPQETSFWKNQSHMVTDLMCCAMLTWWAVEVGLIEHDDGRGVCRE